MPGMRACSRPKSLALATTSSWIGSASTRTISEVRSWPKSCPTTDSIGSDGQLAKPPNMCLHVSHVLLDRHGRALDRNLGVYAPKLGIALSSCQTKTYA